MSKHSKALRAQAGHARDKLCMSCNHDPDELEAAADHMEKLERELRIARKMLRGAQELSWKPLSEPDLNAAIRRINHVANMCGSALAAMRQARRKQ